MKRIDRSKRTKAELLDELKQMERQLEGVPTPDPTAQALARERVTKVRETVKGVSVDNIVSNGAAFGLEVQRTVAELTQQAVQKAEELKTLQDAIDIETEELKRLYQLDVVSASTKALIDEHTEKKAALEREVATIRAAWEEERKAYEKGVAHRNSETETARRREEADYTYRTSQARKQAEEAFTYRQAIAERDAKDRAAQVERELETRRAALTQEEKELADGRARIAALDVEVKARVDREVAIATNSLKSTLTNQFVLEKKDIEMKLSLSEQRNADLVGQNGRLSSEIAKLHVALDAARAEVKDIAIKSVEGASGQTALAKVMEVQRENGTPTRGKA